MDIWKILSLHQNTTFFTTRNLPFTYTIRGNELFISRKEKSITRATVEIALAKVEQLEGVARGPKVLGVFGASYLFSIFKAIGIISDDRDIACTLYGKDITLPSSCNSSDLLYNSVDEKNSDIGYVANILNTNQSERTNIMPRGVKGSGKQKATPKTPTPKTTQTRKPYPTLEERLSAVNAQITRLTVLNEQRTALIAATEAKLQERKTALAKSVDELAKAEAKKAKIEEAIQKALDAINNPKPPKATPEERKAARAEALVKAREAKKAQKAKMDELMKKLEESGKSCISSLPLS